MSPDCCAAFLKGAPEVVDRRGAVLGSGPNRLYKGRPLWAECGGSPAGRKRVGRRRFPHDAGSSDSAQLSLHGRGLLRSASCLAALRVGVAAGLAQTILQTHNLGFVRLKIFLSHASQNRATAESITFSLRGRGYEVFLDRDDLPAGGSYDQKIEHAVKDSEIFVFLIGPDSVAEGRYTMTELLFARRKWPDPTGRVLPVIASKISLDQVPPYLKAVTILEAVGHIAAETSAAVDSMRGNIEAERMHRRVTHIGIWSAAAAVILTVAGVVIWNYGLIAPPILEGPTRLSRVEEGLTQIKVQQIQTDLCISSPSPDFWPMNSPARKAMSEFFEAVGLEPSETIDNIKKLNKLQEAISMVGVGEGGSCEKSGFANSRAVGRAVGNAVK